MDVRLLKLSPRAAAASATKIKFWNGRLYWAVPPRRLEPWTAVGTVTGGHVAAASVGRRPPRRRAPARPPVVVHAAPRSTPRPRERGARMVAASGRDGTGERDDGSGGDSGDGDGEGGPPPPPPRSRALFMGAVR